MTGNLHDSDSESINESSHNTEETFTNVTSPGSSTNSRSNAPNRKTASDYRDELIECERKKIYLIEQKMSSTHEQLEKCDDYHFFMSLLPQMKQFSELQKLRIRNKMSQVIIDETERMQFSSHQGFEDNYRGGYSTGNYNNY
ncbi:unnamed protein product [Leptidea sinapis]|uniref:BESS domain-containing protein n=1 Tax=Leptidea sinapis TaxID=189913 RepID=A0A5E4QP56_9NEOP|nr:unnamed protein product [Leptidea sinapis]